MEKMKVTDELLEQVVPKLSDEMLDEYENSGDGEHKFSERFEKKMKRLEKSAVKFVCLNSLDQAAPQERKRLESWIGKTLGLVLNK